MPIRNTQLQLDTIIELIAYMLSIWRCSLLADASDEAIGDCQLYVLPFILLEDQNNNKYLLTLLLFNIFIKKCEAGSTVSHQKKDPILYDSGVLLCVSTSSIISDLVILIAHKHKEGKRG